MTGAHKLSIAAAVVLAMLAARPVEAGHDQGEDRHGGGGWHQGAGWHGGGGEHGGGGWGWHGGGGWGWHSGWHEAGGWQENGRHLGWYKHGWGGSGWRGTFASAEFGHRWVGPGFVGPRPGLVGLAPCLGLEQF